MWLFNITFGKTQQENMQGMYIRFNQVFRTYQLAWLSRYYGPAFSTTSTMKAPPNLR